MLKTHEQQPASLQDEKTTWLLCQLYGCDKLLNFTCEKFAA